MIVSGMMNPIAKTSMGVIDVRDCALAHLKAIQVDEAKNQRIITNRGEMWLKEIAEVIAEEFSPKGFNVCTTEAVAASDTYFSQDKCSNERIKKLFGMEFRDAKTTLVDMVNGMIAAGTVVAPVK